MINKGKFTDGLYVKYVSINKAVLWRDREISLPVDIIGRIKAEGIKKILFIDKSKKQAWGFLTKRVLETMELKKVGQESQYYFPIELAIKKDIA